MTDKSPPPFAEWPVFIVRGQRVMLDTDLARLFGVSIERIAERVRRNRSRFPKDFLFRITAKERDELAASCRRLRKLKFLRTPPLAFTETGALMLASVLEGPLAEAMNIEIIRAFIQVREVAATAPDLAKSLDALEARYDRKSREVFEAIRQLMELPPQPPRPRIGFGA
jgi:ORF6N domain